MKNLKLLNACCFDLPGKELAHSTTLTIDTDTNHVYTSTQNKIVSINVEEQQIICQKSYESCGINDTDKVLAIQYLADQTALCIATQHGEIILWHVNQDEIEGVGNVDSGLLSMAWSPDLQLVVFATGAGTLILMTCELDPITEFTIETKETAETTNVNVGWGKKQTQFHGSEGKDAAFNSPQSVEPTFSWDTKRVEVSWRGDGEFFTVSSVNCTTGSREMRVWSREGKFHAKSEALSGIEQPVSWRPSGNLIACSQHHMNRHDIIFLEKNGLQHGYFTLPFPVKSRKVVSLSWNLASTVLCVWTESIDDASEPKSYVQFWTTSNYHWYLKQELQFSHSIHSPLSCLEWDSEHAYRIHLLCDNGRYAQYTWCWNVCTATGLDTDHTQVSVIDGASLLVTPFEHMVVPPPLCAYSIKAPKIVDQVVTSAQGQGHLAALLSDNTLIIYKLKDIQGVSSCIEAGIGGRTGADVNGKLHYIGSTHQIPTSMLPCPGCVSHMTWVAMETLVFCTPSVNDLSSVIHIAELSSDCEEVVISASIPCDKPVHNICVGGKDDVVVVQLNDGKLYQLNIAAESLIPWLTHTGAPGMFPQPCTRMAIVSMTTNTGIINVAYGLTEYFRFYANDIEIASNCTSFAVHKDYLLLTTHSHTCQFIRRNTCYKALGSSSSLQTDNNVRKLERGSTIVCVGSSDTKLVLQMPRGNLETIHPRCLLLENLKRKLDSLEFGLSFSLMKRHRINMNLLHDHNPKRFLDNIESAITQINDVHHINIFLTDLVASNVTSSMYSFAYPEFSTESKQSDGKVDVVCDAMIKAFERLDEEKFMLCILTAYINKTKPALEKALIRVKLLTDEHVAKQALKHLLFLVDVNTLFDFALGLYDFELVMMVAEKSQKDPKEYLPFLNTLKKMETNYQRYTIDKHLKKYESALYHLSKCGADYFDTAVSLIKEHRLYSASLQHWDVGSKEYKEVAICYGDFLSSKSYKQEAGIMYMKGECYERALVDFTDAQQWQQAVCALCKMDGNNTAKIAEWARNMAGKLVDQRQHRDAALLLQQYAQDTEEAISVLIQGAEWDEALRMMHTSNRVDFMETDLRPALMEALSSHMEWVVKTEADLKQHTVRLEIVRKQQRNARLELTADDANVTHRDSDLYSDASSATGISLADTASSKSTIFTKASGRTLKNKRKAAKKRWSLKEGSRNEDLALVEAIANIVKQVHQNTDDIASLLRTMVLFHYEAKCRALQDKLHLLRGLIADCIPVVWSSAVLEKQNYLPTSFGPSMTANMVAQTMQNEDNTNEDIDPILRNVPVFNKDYKWRLHCLTEVRDIEK